MKNRSVPAEAIQAELLMDMCDGDMVRIMDTLKSLGQTGRSPDVMAMEIAASTARMATVERTDELLATYAHLIAQVVLKPILKHPSFRSLSNEGKTEFVHDHASLFYAASKAILANLFDKDIIQYTVPKEVPGE
ncbi:hypothetical protein GCM10010331_45320 [Streptomyces xanthochromogenes]|uniref:hypothetical protein n=1 Tax=Streptomyces xanthochromogenes TaxID=67384 RepID=UPI00167970DE|nr:hypothetical protein [Streptomyces xanthochromogenes]GHB52622.1 hypothetical protein GCM10010331_45320 [Streptomyces xanthochromogenes]